MNRLSETTLLILAYFSAVCIGLFDGQLGVAWPSMRASLSASLDTVGLLLLASTAGTLLSSVLSGRLVTQGGLGRFLLVSALLKFVGGAGYALLPGLPALIAVSFIGGIGTGGIATGTNTYVAGSHSAGRLNWMHACYGIGATVGPLLMTGILKLGMSWRWGYAICSVLILILALTILLTLDVWRIRPAAGQAESTHATLRQTLSIPAVWLAITLFLVYTGVEASTGQWSYTLFTEGRAIDPTTAGLWVSIYWGAFTAGRIGMGFIADRLSQTRLVRAALAGAALGAALLWADPAGLASISGLIALALIGFSLAPVFPTLIFTTADRLGSRHAPNAIGFQMGFASIGGAVLPGLAGVLAQRTTLEVIGPFVLAGILLILALHEALVTLARRRAPAAG